MQGARFLPLRVVSKRFFRTPAASRFFEDKIALPDPAEVAQIYREAEQKTTVRKPARLPASPTRTPRERKTQESTGLEAILAAEMLEFLQHQEAQGHPVVHRFGAVKFLNDKALIQEFWRLDRTADPVLLEVEVTGQSASTAWGFAVTEFRDQPLLLYIPFALPGDVVRVSLGRVLAGFAEATIEAILKSSTSRDASLPQCEYFGKCSGCQLQMLSPSNQLEFKRSQVQSAFGRFFQTNERLPTIGPTVASPLAYGYRNKLTPHFARQRQAGDEVAIGFHGVGRDASRQFDLERCAIASPAVNEALPLERQRIKEHIQLWPRGGTLLMRESLAETGKTEVVSDANAIIRESVNGKLFEFPAFSFFQNNPSILPVVLAHLQKHLRLNDNTAPRFLLDTYCGAGLFGIALSELVERVIGIEIDSSSLRAALHNAQLNRLTNCLFVQGTAADIFASHELDLVDAAKACVIMDPSRKGSSEEYLDQLSEFQPGLIFYVSCNVYSQARDMHYFLTRTVNGSQYEVRDIRGFDFFPQTKHVESVAILVRKDC